MKLGDMPWRVLDAMKLWFGVVRMYTQPLYYLANKFEDDIQIVRTVRECTLSCQKLMYRYLHTFIDPDFVPFNADFMQHKTIHDEDAYTQSDHGHDHTHYEAHNNAVGLTGARNRSTLGVAIPTSYADIEAEIRCAREHNHQLKVVGTNHSWNRDQFQSRTAKAVLMSNFTNIGAVDDDGLVTVGSGATVQDVQLRVAQAGWYYPSVPEYTRMTVGGTFATNSHGCSATHLPMSCHVVALEVMYMDRDESVVRKWVDMTGTDATARAFRCSMGRMGIITRFKIRLAKLTHHTRTQSAATLQAVADDSGLLTTPSFALAKVDAVTGLAYLDTYGPDEPSGPCGEEEALAEKETHRAVNAIVVCKSDGWLVCSLAGWSAFPWVAKALVWLSQSIYWRMDYVLRYMNAMLAAYWGWVLTVLGVPRHSATFETMMSWLCVFFNHGDKSVPAHYAQSDYFFYHGYCDHSLQTEFNFDPKFRREMLSVWRETASAFPGKVVPCVLRTFRNDHQHVLLSHGTNGESEYVMSMYCPVKSVDDAERVFTHMIQELDKRRVAFTVHGGKYIPEYMRNGWVFSRNVDFTERYSTMSTEVCRFDYHGLFSVPGTELAPHVCPHTGHETCKCHDGNNHDGNSHDGNSHSGGSHSGGS